MRTLLLFLAIWLVGNEPEFSFSEGECKANKNCFLPFGICLDQHKCLCMPEYADIYVVNTSLLEIKCSYKRKKAVIAGLLELLLPFGAGHFYALRATHGVMKMCIFLFLLGYLLFLYYGPKIENVKYTRLVGGWMVLCLLLPVINVGEMVLFFTGIYKDGHNIPLH